MKLSKHQQQIINCLGAGYSMIQSYDFPVTLTSKTYYSNHRPREEGCSKSTIRKLLELGLIEYAVVDVHRIYSLTELGREHITGKPIEYA